MNEIIRPAPSPYAPPSARERERPIAREDGRERPVVSDPARLAAATMQAVDRIGAAAAEEIEGTAAELERGAHEIADVLRSLAGKIREHSFIASEHVTQFCNKSMSVLDTIGALQAKLAGAGEEGAHQAEAAAEDLRIPEFLRRERERQNGQGGQDTHGANGGTEAAP